MKGHIKHKMGGTAMLKKAGHRLDMHKPSARKSRRGSTAKRY